MSLSNLSSLRGAFFRWVALSGDYHFYKLNGRRNSIRVPRWFRYAVADYIVYNGEGIHHKYFYIVNVSDESLAQIKRPDFENSYIKSVESYKTKG